MRTLLAVSFASTLVLLLAPAASAVTAPTATAPSSASFALWAIDDMVRIDPETGRAFEEDPRQLPGGSSGDYRDRNAVWSAKDQLIDLAGAKNEVIAFQLVIEGQGEGFAVEATPLKGAADLAIPLKNIQLFREWYIYLPQQKPLKGSYTPLAGGWYADVCIPLTESKYGNNFAIPSKDFHTPDSGRFPRQKNQAIWVDIHIPPKAEPGTYTGRITVKNATGQSRAVNVRLKVWDFAIPAEMNMLCHYVNYGATIKEPDPQMMYAYYRMAAEHRSYINDDSTPTFVLDGKDFDWKAFDDKFGPFMDGSAFGDGPIAGQPIPAWPFPIEFGVLRPDKPHIKRPQRDWPLPVEKTEAGYGVVFTDQYRKDLVELLRKVEKHFQDKGWTKTKLTVFQNSLDEPGFHFDGEKGKAGLEQAKAIYDTANLLKSSGLKRFRYRFDVGSGFINNRYDLDGNGKAEGSLDVAKYFAPVVDLWYVHGLCVQMPAVEVLQKNRATVCFYNGFQPRVGSNALNGELLGFRTWAVAAWRSGLDGWVDWQFRLENDFLGEDTRKVRQVWYETQDSLNRNQYIYRGEQIGLPGKVFASMRLKSARRGAQDFEMLRLLTLKDGDDKQAQTLAAKVCKATFREVGVNMKEDDAPGERHKTAGGFGSGQHWSHDPAVWEQFRRQLGDVLGR